MDHEDIDRLFEQIMPVIEGEQYETVMVVLGALHNTMALAHTRDEDRLRELYKRMGDAAVCMAMLEDDNDEFQAAQDAIQEANPKTAREKAGNVPGSSRPN